MSSFKKSIGKIVSAIFVFLIGLTACSSIHPLYQKSRKYENSGKKIDTLQVPLVSISVDTGDDFLTQCLRKHLTFLLSDNALVQKVDGIDVKNNSYHLSLEIEPSIQIFSKIHIEDIEDLLKGRSDNMISSRARYTLKDSEDNIISQRHCFSFATFQQSQQEYANLQAEKNSRERIATDLAEQIFLFLSLDLSPYSDKRQ